MTTDQSHCNHNGFKGKITILCIIIPTRNAIEKTINLQKKIRNNAVLFQAKE